MSDTQTLEGAVALLEKLLRRRYSDPSMFGHDEGCGWHGALDCDCGGDDVRAFLALSSPADSAPRDFERGVASVICIRCMEHRNIPPYNAKEANGGECAACLAEEL